MQVILLKDVKGSGKKGDIVKVNDGYAGNYLIPRKLAIVANNENVNINKGQKSSEQHKKDVEKGDAILLKNIIEQKVINLKMKVSDSGKTFGSITSKEIAEELKKDGIVVDKRKIICDPIKSLGKYEVSIKLYYEVTAKFVVNVEKM